jgi:hypothetical protein
MHFAKNPYSVKNPVQKHVYQTEYYKFSFKIFNSTNLTRKYGIISTIGIKKYLKEADQSVMKPAFEKFAGYFHNPVIQQNMNLWKVEWLQYFNEQKQKAQTMKAEIDKTDREIERMVYELFGLTEEEIGIVEGGIR